MAKRTPEIKRKNGIRARVLLPTLFVAVLQLVMIAGGVFASGMIHNLEINAMDVMQSSADARRDYLQYSMVNRWSDTDAALHGISEVMQDYTERTQSSVASVCADTELVNGFLVEVSDTLIATMRRNAVTGAFVMLCTGDSMTPQDSMPGLYIRDRDPVSAFTSENKDLLLERAPISVVSALGISTDSNWQPLFTPGTPERFEFLFEAYFAARENPGVSPGSLAHWSGLHTLSGDDAALISCTMPLVSADGTLYGVFGVEVLLDHLVQNLPYAEIGGGEGTYAVAIKNTESGAMEVVLTNSSDTLLETRTVDRLETLNEESGFLRVTLAGGERLAACRSALSLYEKSSPYAAESWQLVALQPESQLFAVLHQTVWTFVAVLAGTLLVTVLLALFIVRTITRPVTALELEVRAADSSHPVRFTPTRIRELDTLAEAVQSLNLEVARTAGKLSRFLEMSSANLGAFEFDRVSRRVFANRGFFGVFGEPDVDSTAIHYDQFAAKLRRYAPYRLSESIARSGGVIHCVYEIPAEKGTIWVRLQVELTEKFAVGFAEDVTAEYRERRKLEYQRDRDALTGIMNRRAFYVRYHERFQREAELGHAAILMLDLDNLKYLNDTYGHDCGDVYIRATAEALTELAPAGAIAARVSGDEFLLFLSGYADKAALTADIEKLQSSMLGRTVRLPNGKQYPLRISAGVAFYPEDGTAPDLLVRYADFAMYTGKHSVKGQFTAFDAARYEQEAFLLQGTEALNILIEQRRLDYYFQPIVDIHTGAVFAYEALMRPTVPGLERPLDVLRLARQESRLGAIERLTWFSAMRAFVRHCNEGLVPDGCRVFINSISNQILSDADVEQFEREFEKWLSRIVQEHTEEEQSVPELSRRKADLLHRWGGGVAIDDFGSGYSSEIILLSIDPDYVKADGSIVRDIDKSPNKQARVRALVQYAVPRGIAVIAEGVETFEELKALRAIGVHYVQGYYLGRPAPTPQRVDPQVLMGPDIFDL